MNRNKIASIAAAGALVVVACIIPPRGEAQTLARRVSNVRDGKVRMSFAARPDICGFDNGISTNFRETGNDRSNWSKEKSEDVEYDNQCSQGPVRVVATFQGGSLSRLKTYVGGRWRAASGVTDLGTVSTRDATDYLIGLARTQSGKAAGEAVFPVTLADSIEPAQPIYSIAKDDSRPIEVRGSAIFWLSQVADDRAVGMLNDILKSASSSEIQDKAIFGLSQHHSGKGMAILRDYAEQENAPEEARGKAIFWLGQGKDDGGQYLRNLYGRVHSNDLKDKIIFSMSQQKNEASEKWLLDLVGNSSESIENRKKALFWVGQSGTSIQELTVMYGRMSEKEMKDQMIFVFSQRHDRAAVDKLMDIAKNDPDRDARKKAMFWLGQSHDQRVSAFLSDMINR
jgi:HEAT repeat protein